MVSFGIDERPYRVADESTPTIADDEELQEFLYGKFRILQKKNGYRFSVDPVLLASFVQFKGTEQIIDLGTGSGVMPLIFAEKMTTGRITGLEYQEAYADMAARSVRLNDRENVIEIRRGDVRDVRGQFDAESFDVAVCNPPFLPADSGHVNPAEDKAIARHEIAGTLDAFIEAARYLVRQKGQAVFVFPSGRVVDLIATLREKKLEPRRIQFVHSNEHSAAKLVLVEALKGAAPGLKVMRPLVLFNLEGRYTDEVSGILHNPQTRH